MRIFNEAFLVIDLDKESKLISLNWTGFAVSSDYRRGLDLAYKQVLEHGLNFWLADLRDMTAILKDDEKWTNTEWFPKMSATELKKMAIVESSDYFNKQSVDRIMGTASADVPFAVSYFREVQDAKSWLLAEQGAEVL